MPTGLLLARSVGVDPRRAGSGNIGATNVLRTAGLRLGALTLVGDVAKGAFPTLLARMVSDDGATAALTGFAAFLGHLFPPWLHFRGGKGVATALGVVLVLDATAALLGAGGFALVVRATGFVSLASMAGAVAAAATTWLRDGAAWPVAGVMTLLVTIRHAGNIRRLAAGREPRLGRPLSRQR